MTLSNYPNPFDTFAKWLQQHNTTTKSTHPSACVLSTLGVDGFPNARNVSLKELKEPYFIVTGSMLSRKGQEIAVNPRVALTFWWEETARQVRIQGIASPISEEEAHFYFNKRSHASKTVSSLSTQGAPLEEDSLLKERFRESVKNKKTIRKPSYWGGWKINPHRIEFLEFKTSRFHDRILYTSSEEGWDSIQLQP